MRWRTTIRTLSAQEVEISVQPQISRSRSYQSESREFSKLPLGLDTFPKPDLTRVPQASIPDRCTEERTVDTGCEIAAGSARSVVKLFLKALALTICFANLCAPSPNVRRPSAFFSIFNSLYPIPELLEARVYHG